MSKSAKLLDLLYCKTCNKYVKLQQLSNFKHEALICINELNTTFYDIDHEFHIMYCSKCQGYTNSNFRHIGIELVCSLCD